MLRTFVLIQTVFLSIALITHVTKMKNICMLFSFVKLNFTSTSVHCFTFYTGVIVHTIFSNVFFFNIIFNIFTLYFIQSLNTLCILWFIQLYLHNITNIVCEILLPIAKFFNVF